MSFVIGFGGPAENGKSACAEILSGLLINKGYKVKIISFADRLKEACKIIFRLSDKDLKTTVGKATYKHHIGTTPRIILQKFGTEVCRDMIPQLIPEFTNCRELRDYNWTIWTWNTYYDIKEALDENICVIIQDVRFEDEIEMLKFYGADLYYVLRPEYETDVPLHVSEQIIKDIWDDIIHNDGTLNELSTKLSYIL